MHPSLRALAGGIVDYAGTFPPAALPLANALTEYARARTGPDAWMLGRLVLPVHSLSEFEHLAPPLLSSDPGVPWQLNAIVTAEADQQLERIAEFNRNGAGKARVVAVEFPSLPVSQIALLASTVPEGMELFFETALDAELDARLRAIAAVDAAAKVRTGGVSAGASPTPAAIVRFLSAADATGITFKATAGLHHAIRGCYALTDDPNGDTDAMHGYVNLAVAAGLIRVGVAPQEAIDALGESSPGSFKFGPDGVTWKHLSLATADIAETRRSFFRSFGSCAFQQPVNELRRLAEI